MSKNDILLKLDFIHHVHCSAEVTLNNAPTLSEYSHRLLIHSDNHVYNISAVAKQNKQNVLYHDFEY